MHVRKSYIKKFKINFKILITIFIVLVIIINKFFPPFQNIREAQKDSSNILEISKKNKIELPKDTDIIPGSNITYGGKKYSIPAIEVANILNNKKDIAAYKQISTDGQTAVNKQNPHHKYVFLTFDDGPSANTKKILTILKEKDVRATFFVLGSSIENYPNSKVVLKECIEDGNAIANHTYSHDLKKLYPKNTLDIDNILSEFNKNNDLMKSILGNEFNSGVLRLPGGYGSRKYYKDPMLPALDKALTYNNIISIDWNVINGDAEGKNYSSIELLENAKKSSKNHNNIVILMHDTYSKDSTVQMLPDIIDYYKNNGYEFKTIRSS